MVDPNAWPLVLTVVGLIVLVVAFLVYVRQRLKRRGHELRMELDQRPNAKDDRAYNQIRIATAEADLMKRSGVEVDHAESLLDEANRAHARHDFDTAERQARSAHESLVALRSRAPRRLPSVTAAPASTPAPGPTRGALTAPDGPSNAAEVVSATPVGDLPIGPEGPTEVTGRLPKNRAESHFQLTLLTEELGRLPPGATDGAAIEGEQIRGQAQAAYARGDYTEALRLSLRGRRRVGGRLETLPPGRPMGATPSEPADGSGPRAVSEAGTAPSGGAGTTCGRCGKAVRASDQFCRGCGASLKASRCPRCGQALQPDDAFCAGCGAPTAP